MMRPQCYVLQRHHRVYDCVDCTEQQRDGADDPADWNQRRKGIVTKPLVSGFDSGEGTAYGWE